MRLLLLVAAFASAGQARADAWKDPSGAAQVALWPGAAPGAPALAEPETATSGGSVAGKPLWWVTNVSTPTLTVYPAKGKNTGAAVIVFPGGGFMGLAMDLEGTEVCDWLAPKGVTCVLVKYRVPRSEDYWDDKLHRRMEPKVPLAFLDAQQAIRVVRARAAEWGADPHKIGVLGFSAGGYLAAKTATEFKDRAERPDFSVPVYPGHLWRPRGDSDELRLNPGIHVTKDVPPTFLLQAEDDHVDHVEQVLTYYRALQKAGVPVEMHVYAEGGHAFGLRPAKAPITRWPGLVETWLRTIGVVAD